MARCVVWHCQLIISSAGFRSDLITMTGSVSWPKQPRPSDVTIQRVRCYSSSMA